MKQQKPLKRLAKELNSMSVTARYWVHYNNNRSATNRTYNYRDTLHTSVMHCFTRIAALVSNAINNE